MSFIITSIRVKVRRAIVRVGVGVTMSLRIIKNHISREVSGVFKGVYGSES